MGEKNENIQKAVSANCNNNDAAPHNDRRDGGFFGERSIRIVSHWGVQSHIKNTDGHGATQEKWIAAGPYAYITLPSYSSNQYVTFMGWKCSLDGKTYSGGTRYLVKSNTTFTAIWKSYARFFTWQGGLITQKAVTTESTYGTLPSPPAREGYAFLGWFTSDGVEIKSGTIVTRGYVHDITARYKKKTAKSASQVASTGIDGILHGVYDPDDAYKQKDKITYAFKADPNKANWGYVKQCRNRNPEPDGGRDTNDTKDYSVGMCTICAITNLLNRYSVYKYGKCDYVFEDNVIRTLYPDTNKASFDPVLTRKSDGSKNTRYNYFLKHASKEYNSTNTISGKSGKSFVIVCTTISGNVETRKATLRKLLDDHPEGIVIRNTHHSVVLTSYDAENPNDFYGIDTAGTLWDYKSNKLLKDQYICQDDGGLDNTISRISKVWYIQK